jgi:hypothetical protein
VPDVRRGNGRNSRDRSARRIHVLRFRGVASPGSGVRYRPQLIAGRLLQMPLAATTSDFLFFFRSCIPMLLIHDALRDGRRDDR